MRPSTSGWPAPARQKAELLLVLDFPEVPLENHAAERAVREYVIKRKISNGTRTAAGTQAWEVFLSFVGYLPQEWCELLPLPVRPDFPCLSDASLG